MSDTGPSIYSSVDFSPDLWAAVREVAPAAKINQVPVADGREIEQHIGDAEIAVIHGDQDFDPAKAPRLRWLLTASAGVDKLVGGKLWRSPVTICNASGIHAHSMAELVFAMILSLRHRLPFFARRQKQHVWSQGEPEAQSAGELVGLTMGILGYGSVGREVGRLARAFGMRLIATTIDPGRPEDTGFRLPTAGDEKGALPDVLRGPDFQRQLMAESDVVVVALPSAPSTRRAIGEADLRAMKSSAIFINVARGAVVDEQALIRVLQEKRIAGAGLDVFEVEPLPGDSPLWDMDNVIITPHIAGGSPGYWQRLMALLAENIRRERSGAPLLNVVDKQLAF